MKYHQSTRITNTIRVQIQWMDLRRLSKSCSTQNPSGTNPAFFQPEEAWKACTLSQFRHNDAVQLRFLERNSTRIFDRPLPTPSNLFAPLWNLPISRPPFFFQRLFRRMDSWFETTTSSIFNRFNFARTPSVSLKEEDTNDFVPSSEDGWMIILEERRGWWKCQMFSGEHFRLEEWFCLLYRHFFFLRKRKWTKIFLGLFYYWYLYIYISLGIRVEILIF